MQGIDFTGFAGDCTISGQITMFGERLTDFLNGQERFRLHHVVCTSLADGHTVPVDSISVERDELLAVVATGPRGAEAQRVALETARLELAVGPYVILGHLHMPPGSDPMHNVLQRDSMIPLTGATIAYSLAGATVAQDVGTIIINRHQVEWIAPTADEASLFPGAVVQSPFARRLTKDFTGTSVA